MDHRTERNVNKQIRQNTLLDCYCYVLLSLDALQYPLTWKCAVVLRLTAQCSVSTFHDLTLLSKLNDSGTMLTTDIPRLLNAVSRLPCLASLSYLQSEKRTSIGVTTPEVRRRMSAGTRTPYFQHFWKPGSGYYGESLGKLTKGATDICEDFVLSHIDLVPVPSPRGVFTIGDYGTCDGSVSLQLIHKVIEHLRNKHGPDLKIQVLYEDQPTNDYNSLFKTIYGNSSYIHKFDNVFPLACGTSFYKQCVPDNSCDIIMSSYATHWLSDKSHVRSTMFPWRSPSEEEMRVHHEASARDWQKFLLLRATELKQGGLLFVMQPCQRPKSSPAQPGEIIEPARDVWINFDLTWNEFYARDIITREEFQSCSVPTAFRTVQELKAPFENAATSPVRQAGLNLVKEPEVPVFPCFAKTMWRQKLQSDGADDRIAFAQILVNSFRVVLEPAMRNSMYTRTSEEQSAILEQFFERFLGKVATLDPETFHSELIVGRLVAQKFQ